MECQRLGPPRQLQRLKFHHMQMYQALVLLYRHDDRNTAFLTLGERWLKSFYIQLILRNPFIKIFVLPDGDDFLIGFVDV